MLAPSRIRLRAQVLMESHTRIQKASWHLQVIEANCKIAASAAPSNIASVKRHSQLIYIVQAEDFQIDRTIIIKFDVALQTAQGRPSAARRAFPADPSNNDPSESLEIQ